jgi:conjugative transfer signal peptidase TraF
VPVGLYRIDPSNRLAITDLVAVRAPEPLAGFLAERGYLPRSVPLLKRVAALPGQTVCRVEVAVTVDGIAMGEALARDRFGRTLPVWQGCRVVAPDELFLMNFDVRDSFDGRYFGPVARAAVIGRAIPLYTEEDGDGRFVWRASTWPEVQP